MSSWRSRWAEMEDAPLVLPYRPSRSFSQRSANYGLSFMPGLPEAEYNLCVGQVRSNAMKRISRLCPSIAVLFVATAFEPPGEAEEPPNYGFIPGDMYRMPTHFGPSTGPPRGPDGARFDNKDAPKATSLSARFLTNRDQLQRLYRSAVARERT